MTDICKKYKSADDFFINGTAADRRAVFEAVIDGAIERQRKMMREADEILAKRRAEQNGAAL